MKKTILDCNVLISAALTKGVCRSVVSWVLENHILALSEDIVFECAEVARRERFKAYWEDLEKMVMDLCLAGRIFTPGFSSFTLKDKSDEKYLALAQSAQADFFVTGNLKHFPEVVYGCTCVYSPASFQENMMS